MAASLEELRKLQEKDRCVVLQGTAEIGRTHLTRLLDNGWLQEVMKGWYIAARPGTEGDTTVWYTSFWYFIAKYAAVRLGERWCLTADQSLDLYSGKTTVPVQVVIKSPKGHNNTQKLMYDTSLLVFQSEIPDQVYKEPEYGLNLYPLAEALVYTTPRYFQVEKIAARTCLAMIRDAADILKVLAKNGASLRAGRIAGAFRNIGNSEIADSIVSTMKSRLPVMAVKRFPPICCNIVLDIISFVFRVLSIGGADTAIPFKILAFRKWGSAVVATLSHIPYCTRS